MHWVAGIAAAVALIAPPGCVSHRNERLAIGTRPTASFVRPASPPASAERSIGRTPVRAFSRDPSRLDRSRWRTVVVVVPIDGVVHTETFRGVAPVSRRAPADRAGVFPSIGSMGLMEQPNDLGATARELGRAASDPLLAPLRFVRAARGDWWTWSPYEIWKRTPPQRGRWSAVSGRRKEQRDD
jgi:hypothetical protein